MKKLETKSNQILRLQKLKQKTILIRKKQNISYRSQILINNRFIVFYWKQQYLLLFAVLSSSSQHVINTYLAIMNVPQIQVMTVMLIITSITLKERFMIVHTIEPINYLPQRLMSMVIVVLVQQSFLNRNNRYTLQGSD